METVPCSHVSCNCLVGAPGDFCGISCRDQAIVERTKDAEGELACGCGHPDCFRQADSSTTAIIDEEMET